MQTEKGRLAPAQATRLDQCVEYASGAVVSKTLLKEEKGTLTLFAFDEGQGLSEHTAPFNAVVQILDGSAVLVIGGKDVPASTGDIVLMPANVPHAVKAPKPFKMLLTMIRK
ncbi:MAG: cupin domain-containing protein [Deltaproteobacteria bacterium]|nr:cupin domain-containing protein [Deltaproteobacteria bacterium]